MILHSTIARHGLLNNSLPIDVSPRGDCRAATYRSWLYCVFIDNVVPNRVRFASKALIGGWSGTLDGGCESHQGTPAIFTFKGRLYILASGTDPEEQRRPVRPTLGVYNEASSSFQTDSFHRDFHGTPSLVEYRDALYMFYRKAPGGVLHWTSTPDLQSWTAPRPVHLADDDPLTPTLDPVACVYQGLIHLFHDLPTGFAQLRFDGKDGWSRSRPFITKAFNNPPAVVVHDGLLTLVCTGAAGKALDADLYVYRYDGNAVGLVDTSFGLQAIGPAAASVLNGILHVVYPVPAVPDEQGVPYEG